MRRLTRPLCGPARLGSNDQIRTIPAIRARRYDPGAHGPLVHRRRGAVPRRVPRLARGQRSPAGPALGRHPRRLRRAPRVGTHPVRRAVRRGVVAPRVRRPRGQPLGVADLRGGVLRRRRAAARHPERHLPARADDLRVRHAGAEGPHPAQDGRRASRRGARAGRSRTPAATSPASRARPCATTRRRLAVVGPEDVDDARRVLHAPLRALPHRSRRPNATAASPTSSST